MNKFLKSWKFYLSAAVLGLAALNIPAASAMEINILANPGHLSFFESGVTTDQEHTAIVRAAQVWNSVAGRPVIVLNPPSQKIDFVITPVLGFDDDSTLAVTHYLYNTRYVSYLVLLRGHPEMLRQVITHEFGHALGLGHCENPNSVMFASHTGADFPDLDDILEVRKMWTY